MRDALIKPISRVPHLFASFAKTWELASSSDPNQHLTTSRSRASSLKAARSFRVADKPEVIAQNGVIRPTLLCQVCFPKDRFSGRIKVTPSSFQTQLGD